MLALPEDPNIAAAITAPVGALGCAGKFAWPISERDLATRLHRLTAPLLLVWGRNDKLAPAAHVDEWRAQLSDRRATVVDNCRHIPQFETPQETMAAVSNFLQLE
ncbi:hypothetical protein LMG28614_05208 [Paraburkholderia ultramafica]|uniref:AB hydrolase-1 domain-containing protein n=1 Tax=Paraburkholderia ultramafica TaxID=1544867 RepID=A0A6S7BVL3_9BURK|nr:alpha/beta hydrolase [Paraburkholderia ultramafica]CAB3800543.1 hypothetical protein LMG28614_05208 [Paraburkholderia ultramafica]